MPRYPMSQPDLETFDFGPPIDVEAQETPDSPRRPVSLQYDEHAMSGMLYLVTPEKFNELWSRFFDILPSSSPKLNDDDCEPWVLLHSTFGLTWVHVDGLPEGVSTQYVDDALEGKLDPSFAAVTDNSRLFDISNDLGRCDTEGKLALVGSAAVYSDSLIIALLPNKRFHRRRESRNPDKTVSSANPTLNQVFDYPPMAVDPSIITLIEKITAGCMPVESGYRGRPKKQWLKDHFQGLQYTKGYLPQNHALYRHRGNTAVFARNVWHGICYPVTMDEDKAVDQRPGGGDKIPEAYFQKLFVDLQARKRVENTDVLEGVAVKDDSFGPGDDPDKNMETANGVERNEDVEMSDCPSAALLCDGK